ncbi:NADP-dependent oxidoreductase domain-containing protein, partial [Fennellomyces sp. T-0311]
MTRKQVNSSCLRNTGICSIIIRKKSLERLGVDVIDLYFRHRADPNNSTEETAAAMAELVKEGKVRNLGLSEFIAGPLRRAHEV